MQLNTKIAFWDLYPGPPLLINTKMAAVMEKEIDIAVVKIEGSAKLSLNNMNLLGISFFRALACLETHKMNSKTA